MKCKQCSGELSPDEVICPHCGADNKNTSQELTPGEDILHEKSEQTFEETYDPEMDAGPKAVEDDVSPIEEAFEEYDDSDWRDPEAQEEEEKKGFFAKKSRSRRKNAEDDGVDAEDTVSSIKKNLVKRHTNRQIVAPLVAGIEAVIIGILALSLVIITTLVFNYSSADSKPSHSETGIYYVTNAGKGVPLQKAAEPNSASQIMLFSGNAVDLVKKTNRTYWQVMDFESGEVGYIPTRQLTADVAHIKDGDLGVDRSIKFVVFVSDVVDSLPIREKAGFEDDISVVGSAKNGYALGVIEQTNNSFWRVYDYHSKTIGYVNRAKVTDNYDDVRSAATNILGTAEVIADNAFVNLYTHPSNNEEYCIGRVRNHESIDIVEKTNSHYWLVYDAGSKQFAYMECAYIEDAAEMQNSIPDSGANGEAEASDKPIPKQTEANTYFVAGTDELSLRSTPEKSDSNELLILYRDEMVIVIEETNEEYWKVYAPGYDTRGYVNSKCLAQY